MSEGHIEVVLQSADRAGSKSFRTLLNQLTDGVSRKKLNADLAALRGYTFDSETPDRVDEYLGSQNTTGFARIIYGDEYGTEIFWVIDEGRIQKFVHEEEMVARQVVDAYKALHRGLGDLRLGGYSVEELKKIEEEVRDTSEPTHLTVIFFPPVDIDFCRAEFKGGYLPADTSTVSALKSTLLDIPWK